MGYWQALARRVIDVFWAMTVLALLLMLARIATLIATVEVEVSAADLAKTLWTGARFDWKAAAVLFCPFWLMAFVFCRFKAFTVCFSVYRFMVWTLSVLLSLVNYFYIQTYASHIDALIFGLVEGNTRAIFATLYTDYPLVIGLLMVLLIAVGVAWFYRRFQPDAAALVQKPWLVVLLGLILMPLLARGTVGSFPLSHRHAALDVDPQLGRLVPNALIALYWASEAHQQELNFPDADPQALRAGAQAAGLTMHDSRTPPNTALAQRPPHVVLVLMEGMGADLLRYDDPKRLDLLGALRPHSEADYFFRRFVPVADGTINSLLYLLTQNDVGALSQSKYRKHRLANSALAPYVAAGYRLVYLTGQSLGWRQHGDYLAAQGISERYGSAAIAATGAPKAQWQGPWGVSDEALLEFASERLKAAKQPTLMIVLTTLNHSPYTLPPDATVIDYQPPAALRQRFGFDEAELSRRLNAYRYGASALGEFVARSKAQRDYPIVVAATGDHRLRGFDKTHADLASFYSVPFYLYVPASIDQSKDDFDPLRVGSHKDVFPTLYARSLSQAHYASLGGRDMLLATDDAARAFGFHHEVVLFPEGVVERSFPEKLYPWVAPYAIADESIDNKRLALTRNFLEMQRRRTAISLADFQKPAQGLRSP